MKEVDALKLQLQEATAKAAAVPSTSSSPNKTSNSNGDEMAAAATEIISLRRRVNELEEEVEASLEKVTKAVLQLSCEPSHNPPRCPGVYRWQHCDNN
jgi:predicted  nucleic acid-binding Zn-ribbon protein